ncbi:MAG: HD domain-containing protein [bacterium]
MKSLLNFLLEIEKLKGKKRRGWVIHKIKNAETTAEHILHLTMLVWILGRKKRLNMEKALKMALIHDLCEIYSPDFTSYDAANLKEKGRISLKEIMNSIPKPARPTNAQRKRLEKLKQKLEKNAIEKLTAKLPIDLKKEIKNLWMDYENGHSREGRFVKQADKTINLFQGLVYWKKHGKIQHDLWIRRAKEVLDDPVLIEFMQILEKEFCKKCKK